MSNIADHDLAEAVQEIRARARVALHFHPDRPVSGSATVAERLLAEGTYRSQFESKISNGSVSAYPGGERDLWEQQLFGGAYQRPGCQLRERPKYGSLDLMRHSDGPSPRFGSCYLLLDPLATRRCTFTYLDSHQQRDEKGTLAELDAVLAALFEESFYRDFAIGQPGLTPTMLVAHLRSELRRSTSVTVRRAPARNLNHYIEAQVHGDVLLVPPWERRAGCRCARVSRGYGADGGRSRIREGPCQLGHVATSAADQGMRDSANGVRSDDAAAGRLSSPGWPRARPSACNRPERAWTAHSGLPVGADPSVPVTAG